MDRIPTQEEMEARARVIKGARDRALAALGDVDGEVLLNCSISLALEAVAKMYPGDAVSATNVINDLPRMVGLVARMSGAQPGMALAVQTVEPVVELVRRDTQVDQDDPAVQLFAAMQNVCRGQQMDDVLSAALSVVAHVICHCVLQGAHIESALADVLGRLRAGVMLSIEDSIAEGGRKQ